MAKTALFSLWDTAEAADFAGKLIRAGWTVVASRETVALLRQNNLPVTDIADFTGVHEDYGFPPTLHPKVEFALTSSSEAPRIDLVYVINYPAPEGNDIGGRTLLALAAKGGRIAVNSVSDMRAVADLLAANGGVDPEFRQRLADKVSFQISSHHMGLVRDRDSFDAVLGRRAFRLMNGENPYQVPADFFETDDPDPLGMGKFRRVSGEPPCLTNFADSDALLHTLCLMAEAFRLNGGKAPYICAAAKHGNLCGAGADWNDPAAAVEKALFGNPLAVWGGELALNIKVDRDIAACLFKSEKRKALLGSDSWMLDVVMAPSFSAEAVGMLGKRKERKLFENPALESPSVPSAKWAYRFTRGGFMRQPPNNYILDLRGAAPELAARADDLIIAWAAAFSSFHGGNEVALAKDGALISCGGGPSTVDAADFAVIKAGRQGHRTAGAVFAADAFFPFNDAPASLAAAGAAAGLAPSGGKAFSSVDDFFKGKNIPVLWLPEDIRGFCRH
jgi:phosphoribosylaminoimidazolecarboxamide formyltransferase/IMP cyclohydrolase